MRWTLPLYRAYLKIGSTGPLLPFITEDFAGGQLH